MNKKERLLIWHYKHHHLCSFAWPVLSLLCLFILACVDNYAWRDILAWLWFAFFVVSPSAAASALMLVCAEKCGLVESTT